MNQKTLLQTIYDNADNLLEQVRSYISSGTDLSSITEYGESPLRVASNYGRFDVVELLLGAGAERGQLEWTDIHAAVALGSVEEVQHAVTAKRSDLEARDFWDRTPFLVSILVGSIDKASLLLGFGANPDAVGRCFKTPFQYAIQHDDVEMVNWLFRKGFDIEARDQFSNTPLIDASERGKTACVRYLIENGADIFASNSIPERAIEVASNLQIVELLVQQGDDLNDVSEETHALIIGTKVDADPDSSSEAYDAGRHPRFGSQNPESVTNDFWLAMIRSGASALRARRKHDDADDCTSGPVWSYKRFGRTTSVLDDGRIVEIAGEHEDHYDPDFHIYNDVVVFSPGGEINTYCYPESDFPPTDFHTATLLGKYIYIIGRLGYPDMRIIGETPVFRLDTETMKITQLETNGDKPGWIHSHRTKRTQGSLDVFGGKIWVTTDVGFDLQDNDRTFRLSLDSLNWSRVA